ncbi:MAG: AMP-binding protein [Sandaracinus sp.]
MPLASWADRARRAPDAPALVTLERTWTSATLAAELSIRARAIVGARCVALVGRASADHVLDLLAAIDAGVPVLLLHPRWSERETRAIVERVGPDLVLDGGVPRRAARALAPPALDGVLAIVATSGTTGAPKLALLSRHALEASARASAAHLGAHEDDRWLLAMPLAHVGGLGVVVRSLVYETTLVVHEGAADPAAWLPLAERAGATHVSLVPTTLARLLDAGLALPASTRVALVGGAACPTALVERALAQGVPIHTTYGLTETCGQVATSTTDPRKLVPLPGVALRVVSGSIRVRAPTAMDGWLDAPSPFDAEGFYDTGDLGELEEDGSLRIHARRTDLIVSGGENVYPREVEDALERVPGIRAACVFGVEDPTWGQRVAAALVVNDDAPSDEALVASLRRELAGFKLPRAVARLEALALNATGKVDRAATAALAAPRLIRLPSPR